MWRGGGEWECGEEEEEGESVSVERRGRVGVWRGGGGGGEWECGEEERTCGGCVELPLLYLFPIKVDVSTERSSGAREGEHRQRDRNRNIDTNLCASVWVCVCVSVCGGKCVHVCWREGKLNVWNQFYYCVKAHGGLLYIVLL